MIKPLVILLFFIALASATGQDEMNLLEDRLSGNYPDCMEGTIYIGYDNRFKAKFGSESANKINQIYAIAKDYLNGVTKRDLKTHLDFKMKGTPQHHDISINNVVTDIGNWASIVDNVQENANIYVLFTARNEEINPAGMANKLGGLCQGKKSSKALVVAYFDNDRTSAQNLLTEIGHVMGMKDDWSEIKKDDGSIAFRNRFHWNGQKQIDCTTENGFMGVISRNRKHWSLCSLDDFKDYYNKNKNNRGEFCLLKCETCFDKKPAVCDHWAKLDLLTYFCLQTDYCQRRCAACRPRGWIHG